MKVKNIFFIFPPQFEPFQPYLSLPILASVLKEESCSFKIYDFNIDYFNWILTPSYIERSLRDVKTRQDRSDNFIFERGEYALDHLIEAKRIIGNQEEFADLPKYKWAMNVLRTALEVVSERFSPSKIDFYEARCGPTNYDSHKIYNTINDSLLNLFEEFINEIVLPILKNNKPDFVGFSLVVHDQLAFTLSLCREIRRLFPEIHLCIGGPLVSRLCQEMSNIPYISQLIDSFVVGEGEVTISELVSALKAGMDPTEVPGVLEPRYQDKFKRRLLQNSPLTILPDFSCLALDKYFSPYLVLPYLTSYGCYWRKCSFCCHRYPYGRYIEKPIELVVDQLSKLTKNYGTKYFSFSDESIPPKRMHNLALEIINRGLDIRWFTFTRMEKAFKELNFCNLIYHAGCRTLMFGFESAVQRVLDLMQKGTEAQDVPEILSACNKASISVRLDTMIGFPGESETESDYTLKFIRKHRHLIDTPFSITPLSLFELQKDSLIMHDPEKHGICPKKALRGDLDYQVDYEIHNGMNNAKKYQAYKKYICALISEFDAPHLCPENKAHAFIMKCLYEDRLISIHNFSNIKERPYEYVPILYECIQCKAFNSDNGSGCKYLLSNLLNGMKVEIDCFCKKTIDMIECGYSVAEILAAFAKSIRIFENDRNKSLKAFLQFLVNHDFIYFITHIPPIRNNLFQKSHIS